MADGGAAIEPVAVPCRGCGAAFDAPAHGNPRYCEGCLSRIPFPGMDWQARLPGRLHAMTGGETPAVFGCLVDAAAPRPSVGGRGAAGVRGAVHRARAAAWLASPWVSGDRADRVAYREALARSGRCSMEEGRCMVTAEGGPMGRLRIEVPAFLCGQAARAVPGESSQTRAEGRGKGSAAPGPPGPPRKAAHGAGEDTCGASRWAGDTSGRTARNAGAQSRG